MNLAELRGGVYMRLGPRDKIPPAAVDIEIFNAMRDVLSACRRTRSERIDQVAYADIISGLDIYPWPEEADEIRALWFLNFGQVPIPMTKVAFEEQPIVEWVGNAGNIQPFTYAQLPERRIRMLNMPYTNVENGLMFKYTPRPKRLTKASDVPNIPEQIHECIIPRAVMRLAGYDGIGLSHPAGFNIYAKQMEAMLYDYLQPESPDGGDHILDNDVFYPGGA